MQVIDKPESASYKYYVLTEDEKNPFRYVRSRFDVKPGERAIEVDPCRSMEEIVNDWRAARAAQAYSRQRDLERRQRMTLIITVESPKKSYNAEFAPLAMNYEEEVVLVPKPTTTVLDLVFGILDTLEDILYDDDYESFSDIEEEQGAQANNYMMYEQETYPCYRLPGESNPFFVRQDYCLLGGGKTRKKRPRKKNMKKNRDQNLVPARQPYDVQRPGRNDFPMVRHMVQPMTLIVPFSYDIGSELFNNAGGTIVGEVYQSNDGYDWLLSILTSAMQFLNRQFQLYGKAKVIKFDIDLFFDNLEQNAIDLFFFSSSESPTSIAASKASLVAAAATGIYRGGFSLSEQYGKQSSRVWHDRVKPANVVGNKLKYNSSDDYSFTQSSGPPRITYYSWYATTPLNAMSLGFSRRVRIYADILFYDLLTVTSLLKPVNVINPRSKGSERYLA